MLFTSAFSERKLFCREIKFVAFAKALSFAHEYSTRLLYKRYKRRRSDEGLNMLLSKAGQSYALGRHENDDPDSWRTLRLESIQEGAV